MGIYFLKKRQGKWPFSFISVFFFHFVCYVWEKDQLGASRKEEVILLSQEVVFSRRDAERAQPSRYQPGRKANIARSKKRNQEQLNKTLKYLSWDQTYLCTCYLDNKCIQL